MKSTTTALSIDDLLPLEDFVRSLARRLVKDAAEADDVVQEALLLAWKRPPRDKGALPAWLGTVVRRLASRRRQMDKARDLRERKAAQAESLSPSPEDILFREEKRRLVVEQLLALPENHREVLLLHYYEGLSPKEIAARLSRPAGTVRSQLKRGLDELRERLDRAHDGDRRSWALALIPMTLPGLGRPALVVSGGTILGVLAMNKMMVTVAAALVLASWGMWETWLRDPGNEIENTTVVESVLSTEERGQDDQAGDGDNESVVEPQRQEVLTDPSPTAKAGQLRLELSDAAGVPVPDLPYGIIDNEFGNALEGWSHEVMSRIQQNLLAQASRSTIEGLMIVEDKREGMLLWVERKDELFEFFDLENLPSDGKLHLAAEKSFVVSCMGLEKHERWHLYLQPAIRDQEDGSWSFGCIYRKHSVKPGRPLYVAMEVRQTEHQGGAPIEILVPEGQPYNVELVVERHTVTYDGEEHDAKVAPAAWRFAPGPLLPKVEVLIVDANDKPLPPQSGMWAVQDSRGMIDHEKFVKQNPISLPFQSFQQDAKYRIQVITEMGDYKNWTVEFDKKREDKTLRLVRASTPAGLKLAVPDSIDKNKRWTMQVEKADGQLGGSVNLMKAPWMTTLPLPAFIPGGQGLIFLAGDQEFKRLWLHTSDGALAVYDPSEGGVAAFRALPLGERGEIDLQKIYKKLLATGTTVFELRIEPRPGVVLRIHQMQTVGTATRWDRFPHHLPKGMKAWLHVRMHERSRVPVKIALPLEDKD